MTESPTLVQCWSGPRNISTALMYSFRQRSDTAVVDEPLYAHYLNRTGRHHPVTAQVIASQSIDADLVIDDVIRAPGSASVRYVKQMAHHYQGVDPRVLDDSAHVLLIRDPAATLASLSVQLPDCTLADLGLIEQVAIAEAADARGRAVVVVDSAALLAAPAPTLEALCAALGLPFDPAMLSWPAGPKPEDGVWAPEWYHRVHQSTGFEGPAGAARPLPPRLEAVLDQAQPLYNDLHATRLAV